MSSGLNTIYKDVDKLEDSLRGLLPLTPVITSVIKILLILLTIEVKNFLG